MERTWTWTTTPSPLISIGPPGWMSSSCPGKARFHLQVPGVCHPEPPGDVPLQDHGRPHVARLKRHLDDITTDGPVASQEQTRTFLGDFDGTDPQNRRAPRRWIGRWRQGMSRFFVRTGSRCSRSSMFRSKTRRSPVKLGTCRQLLYNLLAS